MADVKMIVVDGIRYREQDAPGKVETRDEPTKDPARKQRTRVPNKARTADDADNK